MNIQAKLLKKYEAQQISASFKKREFVVEYAENPLYPQFIKFECIQDRCSLLDEFEAGDEIDISFNLRGREWKAPDGEVKYFNTIEAWRLTKVSGGANGGGSSAAVAQPVFSAASSGDEADDLPF